MSTVAVLAVQGAFAEHRRRLEDLGCTTVLLRRQADLKQPFDGLVLPGGESTAQGKLLEELGMLGPLRRCILEGMAVLGTCAGLILLARKVESLPDGRKAIAGGGTPALPTIPGFGTLPITVRRNGYGRQLRSFHAHTVWRDGRDPKPLPLTFIRAPRILKADPAVETLATLEGNQPVAVRFGNQLACTFHPELDSDDRIYRLFLEACRRP